jgi:hypothetical protein
LSSKKLYNFFSHNKRADKNTKKGVCYMNFLKNKKFVLLSLIAFIIFIGPFFIYGFFAGSFKQAFSAFAEFITMLNKERNED